ncbi:MAG: OmpH family outer membrane protein [Pseudomonadota bacterium]|nr:OmpH family outer membrane protein [Pseudomonadota bacterium]
MEKKILNVFCAVFAILASAPFSASVLAQVPYKAMIGIVDVEKILRDSKASQSIRPTINEMRKDFQKQVSEHEQKLRRAEQELNRQRAILAPEAFAKKRRTFSEQARKAQTRVQERRRDLDKAFNDTKNKILQNLIIVAQELATEKKLNVLLEKRKVFISAKKLDLTSDIIKRLNKRLPKVSIDISKIRNGSLKDKN